MQDAIINELEELEENPLLPFLLIFVVSGFAGLIYESIWTHYLKLFLGHAAYAQTLVLVIFMGGMSIGSWFAGKLTTNISNLLRAYAVVELLIGLCAICFHSVFTHITQFAYQTVLPSLESTEVISLFKWSIAALIILPQSILLGATFPLMSSGVIRAIPEHTGRSLALLYFSNSLGAAIGILTSGYFLINLIGLPGTIKFGLN